MDDIAQVLTDAGWTVKEGHNNLGYYDSSSEGSSYDNAMYKLARSIQAIELLKLSNLFLYIT